MKVFIIMARLFFSLWRIILANWFAVLQVQLGKFFLQYHVVWAFSAVRCYREFYLIIFSCWKPFHCGCKFKPRSCHWMKLGCNMVCCYVLLFFFFWSSWPCLLLLQPHSNCNFLVTLASYSGLNVFPGSCCFCTLRHRSLFSPHVVPLLSSLVPSLIGFSSFNGLLLQPRD